MQNAQDPQTSADAGRDNATPAPPNLAPPGPADLDPVTFWEQRYGEADRIWSGRVNAALAAVASGIAPGRSLDLGCGEGGDVLWLAGRGWRATGIDLSQTAVARGRAEALSRGVEPTFIAADLADWVARPADVDGSPEPFDLVTASFLQSPAHLPRPEVLRAAAARVAPGGRLVLVSHGAPPSWAQAARDGAARDGAASEHATHAPARIGPRDPQGSDAPHVHHHGPSSFPTPEAELADLALDPAEWRVEVAERREREAAGPDGAPGVHVDTVVVAHRQS